MKYFFLLTLLLSICCNSTKEDESDINKGEELYLNMPRKARLEIPGDIHHVIEIL